MHDGARALVTAVKASRCKGGNGLKGYWWGYKLSLNSCYVARIVDLGTTFSVLAGVLTAIFANFNEKRVASILGAVTAVVALGAFLLDRCGRAGGREWPWCHAVQHLLRDPRGVAQEPVKGMPMTVFTTWRARGWGERACAVLLVLVAVAAIVTYVTALDASGKAAVQVASLAIVALVASVAMSTAHLRREARQRP